jgi:hypothetical protein
MARKPKAAKPKPAKANGHILQITPIIIKRGDSLHIRSELVKFEDDDGKKINHVQIKHTGRIGEVSIVSGIGKVSGNGSDDTPLDIMLTGKEATVFISFLREP